MNRIGRIPSGSLTAVSAAWEVIVKKSRLLCAVLAALFVFLSAAAGVSAAPEYTAEADAVSCILMDAKTGRVLFEKNADEALPPASVTKVMTMLLVFEALDAGTIKLSDMVQASEHAASMGGSQIYLKVGEEMSVDDLLKSLIVASANDAAVALAEYIAGSEESFVAKMNARAEELGMKNTHFENTNGLDDTATNHVTSARDIAIMTREVVKHEAVFNYSTIWMDTIRDGAFGLTNTNRLIRFYKGATGLKTGSTAKAKFCISATAERDGLSLIAVIMGSPTRDVRNALAASLFDFGFANYASYTDESAECETVRVTGGVQNTLKTVHETFSQTVEKGTESKIEKRIDMPEKLAAPIVKGEKIGTVTYLLDGKELGTADILADETVEKIGFFTLFPRLFGWFLCSPSK
ncbi:MAG: D-alanyl-D-alanine carboxypeptidase [Clostridiales bacterium]|nr:D-alanyl-D-alanine carboxypeptidase [Clostridiales bacterium]